jgi:hypothetical protein
LRAQPDVAAGVDRREGGWRRRVERQRSELKGRAWSVLRQAGGPAPLVARLKGRQTAGPSSGPGAAAVTALHGFPWSAMLKPV